MTVLRLAALITIGILAFAASAVTSRAHARLDTSSPGADALLAIPPTELELIFTEPVDLSAVSISAIDEQGRSVSLGAPTLDPQSDRRLLVTARDFSIGTYTISWINRSTTDGHPLSGSFAFRVGGTSRAPAAATVEGERPPGWGIATRWLTFLGTVTAVGLLLITTNRRRTITVRGGLVLALLATIAEPLFLSVWPPAGTLGGTVVQAVRAEPHGWWLRLTALVLALAMSLMPLHVRRMRSLVAGAALAALGGLSLTSHAAGRESLAWAAVGVAFMHNASLALWVGPLALIVAEPSSDRWAELRQFSRRALTLAPIAVATGVVNAILLVPSFSSLTTSDYGRLLLAKITVVVLIFAIAAYHYRTLKRHLAALPGRLGRSVRLELAGIALAVVLASTLALLSPPVVSRGDLDLIQIGMPTNWETTADQVFVRLDIAPRDIGTTALSAYATNGPPATVEQDSAGKVRRVDHPALPEVQRMWLDLSSLNHEIAPRRIEMDSVGDGRFSISGLTFSAEGWWRAVVTVRLPGVAEDRAAEFILRVPDPNLVGFDAAVNDGSNPAAEQIFTTAVARMKTVPWNLSKDATAGGGAVETGTSIRIGETYDQFSTNVRVVRVAGKRYLQRAGDEWQVSTDTYPPDPATRMSDYDGATNFMLGNVEEIDGRTCQIIVFYVPGGRLVPAFYAWWVEVDTGLIVKEAMVSRNHFMNRIFLWSEEPAPIEPPV